MSTVQIRASLRLWNWRQHRWQHKLAKAHGAERKRLQALISKASKIIGRREQQLRDAGKHYDWMPGVRKLKRSGTPWQISCPSKGVLHTTEGSGDATATLDANGDHPHFQVEQNGRITQYIPMSEGSKALKHVGDPPTNGAHAFQIEVCGFAAHPDWPEAQRDAVRRVMRFIEHNGGVARECNVRFGKAPKRLTGPQWLELKGWCGHQHVPENDHVDPGAIKIQELL